MPPPISNSKFSNPFVMDPTDAKHLMTAGKEVVETVSGPDTRCDEFGCDWEEVFDLGNAKSEGEPPNSMSALDLLGDAAYVGYCGVCDILNRDPKREPFLNGLATNVSGDQPPKRMTSQGWHHAKAKGLPNRYITSIAIDPQDPKTVYVALGGYANRQWVPPGSYLDRNQKIGAGHVFKSTNAGRTFKNISGNLPNLGANWIEIHRDQLVVARIWECSCLATPTGRGGRHSTTGSRRCPSARSAITRALRTRSWPQPLVGACTRTPSRARAGDPTKKERRSQPAGGLARPPLRVTSARTHDVAATRIGVVPATASADRTDRSYGLREDRSFRFPCRWPREGLRHDLSTRRTVASRRRPPGVL